MNLSSASAQLHSAAQSHRALEVCLETGRSKFNPDLISALNQAHHLL